MQMMRCTEPVWLGDEFVAKDTLLPVGHPLAVEPYFTPIEIADGGGDAKPTRSRGKRS